MLWMDAIHFAPAKNPWNDKSTVNANEQRTLWFPMVSQVVRNGFRPSTASSIRLAFPPRLWFGWPGCFGWHPGCQLLLPGMPRTSRVAVSAMIVFPLCFMDQSRLAFSSSLSDLHISTCFETLFSYPWTQFLGVFSVPPAFFALLSSSFPSGFPVFEA